MGIEKEQLDNLYITQKLNATQCGEQLGYAKNTILYYLRKYSIPRRKGNGLKKDISQKELEDLYIGQKLTMRKCAEYFNCDPTTIMNWLREYGISSRNYSESRKGRKVWNKGIYAEDDPRIASGDRQGNWNGGTYGTKRQREMGRGKYINWRRKIFERDSFTCVICKEVGGRLNAHHIESWVDYPERRYDIDNGITLCEGCHKDVHRDEIDCIEYLRRAL